MDVEFKKKWQQVKDLTKERFGEYIDMQSLLFVIGLQELAHGHVKLSKDQKLDVIHIAVCTLLQPYGYYKYEGRDKDDWPHWSIHKKLPHLAAKEQERLMREAIIQYFGLSNG